MKAAALVPAALEVSAALGRGAALAPPRAVLPPSYQRTPSTSYLKGRGVGSISAWHTSTCRASWRRRSAEHRTIARDRPVLTLETTVHLHPQATLSLLAAVEALGYDAYIVEEIRGLRPDCRNLLALPREAGGAASPFKGSHVLNLAASSKQLMPVDASTILRHAFPCCQRGRECCPHKGPCCSHNLVGAWMSAALNRSGVDLQWFTRLRGYDQEYHGWSAAAISLPMLK